jgi:hypothetical protein
MTTTNVIAAKNPGRRGQWWGMIRIGVACGLLLLLLPTILQPQFFNAFNQIRLPLALLAFSLSLASVVAKSGRWQIVLRASGINVPLGQLVRSYFVGLFFNNFLPSGMGGDAVRAFDSARSTGRGTAAVTAVIMERGTGMFVVFGGGSLFALFQPNLPLPIALVAHGLFIGASVGVFLLWQDRTGQWIDWCGRYVIAHLFGGRLTAPWNKIVAVYGAFYAFRQQRPLLLRLLLQAVLTQTLAMASLYSLISSLGTMPPVGAFIAVTGIATSLDVVPISLNSLGVREGVYVYFLGLLSVASPVAAAFALSIRLMALLQALIGGVIFLWRSAHPIVVPVASLD